MQFLFPTLVVDADAEETYAPLGVWCFMNQRYLSENTFLK
jgi:hypothetical protein